MKKLSPETIEKLEWLKCRLRKYPHRYDQGEFCGTHACLAGFCTPKALASRKVTFTWADPYPARGYEGTARYWLRIDFAMGTKLFAGTWSGKARKFNRVPTDTDKQAAEKACQRIDLFIQSGGTQ